MMILIVAAAIPVQAEDDALFLSTGSAHYQYSLNEDSRIPVKITNNLGNDLPGTIVVQIRDPKTGEYVYSQSKQMTAFSGEDMYYISAGNAGDGQDILVDISFEYGNGPIYSSELKGISLSFSNEEPLDDETEEGVETDTGSAPVKSTSEIKSGNPETTSYASNTADGEINAVEEQTDADALKRTLLEEQIEREMQENALTASIKDDPIFLNVNTSLYIQNFSRLSFAVNTHGNNSGVFSSLYRDTTDETVSLFGTVNDGRVTNIFENTTAIIALPGIFLDNESFRGAISETESEGFVRSGTEINTSATHSDVRVLYEKGIYHAEILADSVNGTVTSVTTKKDDILPIYVLPAIILVFTGLNALIVYAYYTMKPGETEPTEPDTTKQMHPAEDATILLRSAELLFAGGHKPEAVSMAVRALRMNISTKPGVEREISDGECRAYLLSELDQNLNPEKREQALTILQTTEKQRFAEVDISEKQFRTLIDAVKGLIRS